MKLVVNGVSEENSASRTDLEHSLYSGSIDNWLRLTGLLGAILVLFQALLALRAVEED